MLAHEIGGGAGEQLTERQHAVLSIAEQPSQRCFGFPVIEAIARQSPERPKRSAHRAGQALPAIGERGPGRQRRGHVLQPETAQIRTQLDPHRTADEDRMQRRRAVVMKARGAELGGPDKAARLRHLLEQDHASPRVKQVSSRDQRVMAGADEHPIGPCGECCQI
jgi:hypothetical protein